PAVRAEPCVKRSFLWSQRSFVPNKPLSPPALPSFDALIPSLATNLRSGELSRLGSYEDDGVTDELYGFGTMLVHDAVDRLSKINGTAGAIAAYCAGLITILTST